MKKLILSLCFVCIAATAADIPYTLLCDWSPTNPPQEQIEVFHSTSLTAPQTSWTLLSTVPGYVAIPPTQPTWSLTLIFPDATGTNWQAAFYMSNSASMTTSVVTHVRRLDVTVADSTNHFFAARSVSGGQRSPFSDVTGDWYPQPMRLRIP